MRAFLSLDVEDAGVLREMLKVQEGLSTTGADLKLVERENLHFTVKFFGEVPEAQVEDADARIRKLEMHAMQVQIRGVGAFPDIRSPRVLWAGLPEGDASQVASSAELVIRATEGIGEPEDRKYHPHITLARVRSGRNKHELARFLESNKEHDFGATQIRTMKLRSSTLTPRGPVYSELKTYILR